MSELVHLLTVLSRLQLIPDYDPFHHPSHPQVVLREKFPGVTFDLDTSVPARFSTVGTAHFPSTSSSSLVHHASPVPPQTTIPHSHTPDTQPNIGSPSPSKLTASIIKEHSEGAGIHDPTITSLPQFVASAVARTVLPTSRSLSALNSPISKPPPSSSPGPSATGHEGPPVADKFRRGSLTNPKPSTFSFFHRRSGSQDTPNTAVVPAAGSASGVGAGGISGGSSSPRTQTISSHFPIPIPHLPSAHAIQRLRNRIVGPLKHALSLSAASSITTEKALKSALIEFHRGLGYLRDFIKLNQTGFEKILKKHDKVTGYSLKDLFLSTRVYTLEFGSLALLDELLQEVECVSPYFSLIVPLVLAMLAHFLLSFALHFCPL